MVCLRVLCARCAGAHSGQLCELLKCRDCRVRAVDGGTLTARTNELMKRVDEMEAMGARDSTMRTQRRGVQDYLAFCGTRGAVGLPATEFDLKAYVVWALLERTPRLDTSSIRTNLSGVSAWHVSLRAHPAALAADVLHVGGSSPRKSMTQWLWEAGHSKRAISDMGGWRSQKEGVDYYFTTSKLQMLQIKTELDPTLPPRTGRA